jgi:hypothetical protein
LVEGHDFLEEVRKAMKKLGAVGVALILCGIFSLLQAPAQVSKKPLSKEAVIRLLKGEVSPNRVAVIAREQGIDFQMSPETEKELRAAGATEELLAKLRNLEPQRPAPTAEPSSTTTLLIGSTPGGAQVYVDDEFAGKTNTEGRLKVSNLAVGEHRVRLSADGYRDREEKMNLAAGTMTYRTDLEALKPHAPAHPGEPAPVAATKVVEEPMKGMEPESTGVVYLLDSTDQPLKPLPKETAQVVSGRKGLTGGKGSVQIPGSASSFRFKSGKDLEFVVKCTNPESFELYAFTTKGDNREAVVSTAKAHPFGKVTVQRVGAIKFDVTKYGESSYRFVVTAPEPGEYAFLTGWSAFDFAVDPK